MPLLQALIGTTFLMVLWVGGRGLLEGRISLGTFVMFNTYMGILIWPMIAFGWVVNLMQRGTASLNRINEMVRHARRNYVGIENTMFVVGSVDEIPWDANFFTHAISVESAYYWPNPERGLKEIFRVLREGGMAWVLINYYGDNPHCHQWGEHFGMPANLLSAAEWEDLFRAAGLRDISHRQIPDPTPAPEFYQGRWLKDAAQLRAFREVGALLIRGTK